MPLRCAAPIRVFQAIVAPHQRSWAGSASGSLERAEVHVVGADRGDLRRQVPAAIEGDVDRDARFEQQLHNMGIGRARGVLERRWSGRGRGASRRWRTSCARGCTKPGSLTRCLSSLRQTASRMSCSRSSSVAPVRSGVRRSVSLREKRQVRRRPSAVRRMRSQSPQKGSETGLIRPILPTPSANRCVRAVACGARSAGSSGKTLVDGVEDLGAGQDLRHVPRAVAVERHVLDEAHLVGVLAGEAGEREHLLLGEAADRDRVDLDRVGLRERREVLEAAQDAGQRVAAGLGEEAVALERVDRDVEARDPGLDQRLRRRVRAGSRWS